MSWEDGWSRRGGDRAGGWAEQEIHGLDRNTEGLGQGPSSRSVPCRYKIASEIGQNVASPPLHCLAAVPV